MTTKLSIYTSRTRRCPDYGAVMVPAAPALHEEGELEPRAMMRKSKPARNYVTRTSISV